MNHIPPRAISDTELLGVLAMQFRSTRDQAERRAIAQDYSQVVDRLIQSGHWDEVPAPEDQLPDKWMPEEFFTYWHRRGTP